MPAVSDSAPFSEADLLQAAGERSYSRGPEYVDAVRNLQIGAREITATVYGTDEYEIVLDLDADGVGGECSCPYGQEGFFCKHLVAARVATFPSGGQRARRGLRCWTPGWTGCPGRICSRWCTSRSARTGACAAGWNCGPRPLARTRRACRRGWMSCLTSTRYPGVGTSSTRTQRRTPAISTRWST